MKLPIVYEESQETIKDANGEILVCGEDRTPYGAKKEFGILAECLINRLPMLIKSFEYLIPEVAKHWRSDDRGPLDPISKAEALLKDLRNLAKHTKDM